MWWLLLLLIFLVGCTSAPTSEDIVPVASECVLDSDCARAGCSGQLCMPTSQAADIITTCEFRDEYVCYQQATCGCVEGQCDWKEDLSSCLAEHR